MRRIGTCAETSIRASICEPCSAIRNEAAALVDGITDRPDIVVSTVSGVTIGIEVTRLAYEEYMRWLSRGTPVGKRREATITVNLDRQLRDVLKKKNKRYHEYKRLHKLDQVWLCLHNDLYEPGLPPEGGNLELEWFRAAVGYYCLMHECKFDQVLFYNENSKQYVAVFDKLARRNYLNPGLIVPTIGLTEMVGVLTKEGLVFDETYALVDNRRFGET